MMINIYIEIIEVMEKAFFKLEADIERPSFVKRGSYRVFRYDSQSIEAAIIQKLARIISGLHATLNLINGGFLQEIGVIFRTLDEFNEDIIFLSEAIINEKITEKHKQYLKVFYQEEFDKPDNPLNSTQKRHLTPRKKIQATISNMRESELNPSDHKEILRTISQAYSGYVHGASSNIMEMYGGNPPQYNISGMLDSPNLHITIRDSWNYFYRGFLSVMFVAKAFKDEILTNDLYLFRDYIEEKSGHNDWKAPEELIKGIKKERFNQTLE